MGIMAKVCKITGAEENMKTEWLSTYSIITEMWGLEILVEELLHGGKKWKLLFIFVEVDSIYSCKEL